MHHHLFCVGLNLVEWGMLTPEPSITAADIPRLVDQMGRELLTFMADPKVINSPFPSKSKTLKNDIFVWLYVRYRGQRWNAARASLGIPPFPSLVFANVEVAERLRGKGALKALLEWLELNAPQGMLLEFELVHNKELCAYLERSGWSALPKGDGVEHHYMRQIGSPAA